MSYILNAFPGQPVTIAFETLGSDGYRLDGYNATIFGAPDGYGADGYYNLPVVMQILLPTLTPAAGYPQKWSRLDTGLYYFRFTLPTGATAVGTYIVNVKYVNPILNVPAEIFFQVICQAPFGQYSISTF